MKKFVDLADEFGHPVCVALDKIALLRPTTRIVPLGDKAVEVNVVQIFTIPLAIYVRGTLDEVKHEILCAEHGWRV